MRQTLACFLYGLTFFFLLAPHKTVKAEDVVSAQTYNVGVARIDVTPDFPVRLSGFGFRREETDKVQMPIYARALAISSEGGKPVVLLTVDSTGISREMFAEVAERLKPEGITPATLAISATHTHTAPMLENVLPTLFGQPIPDEHQQHITRYTKQLTDQLVEVAQTALQDRQPSQLWWSRGEVAFAKNRRDTENGPTDHGLPVLAVKSLDGELRAVLASYACHAVTLSHNEIGGDWPGFASEWIERRHPGAIGMIAIGCGADQNPIPGVTGDNVDMARSQGLELATEVDRILGNAMKPVSGDLTAARTELELPLEKPHPRSVWEERAKQGRYIGYHAQVQLETLDRGDSLMTAVPYSVQSISFGDDLAMVFLPGEVVVDYALRLRKELDASRMWVMAYSNATPCYIPSERVLKEGGYEGERAMTYYNKPNKFAPGLEQKIFDHIHEVVPASFHQAKSKTENAGLPRRTPAQSLKRLTIPSEWKAQVVAAEPLTTDPVAVDFGPDGALWVCEMHDYPSGLHGNFEAGGKIRLLRDDNNDGIYDRSTIFLDGLPFPTGVTVWRNGVLICAAPDIIYAEDTDGDDKADKQQVLFSGFGTENYQARVNSLQYGLDGWVYGSCGLFGGEIECRLTGETVALGNRDFRIDPDRGLLEPLTDRSQQGRVRNDDGDWFGCSNGQPCWHFPLLKDESAPGLSKPALKISVPVGDPRKLYPETANYQRFKLSGPAGRVTAACGIGIYRDTLLGEQLQRNSIVCEPVNLLLHRRVLKPEGITFRGERASGEATSELLTSTDNWFRPVQVRTGPDGCLWIADMSRSVIEHPRWIPEETLAQLDVRAGDEQGRLIRLMPKNQPPRTMPDLTACSGPELVEVLRSPNGTQRDLAQQMLLWNRSEDAIPELQTLANGSDNPHGRIAALWILAKYEALPESSLASALEARQPVVRRQATRILHTHGPQFLNRAKLADRLKNETDLFVVKELVQFLRTSEESTGSVRLCELYSRHADDPHLKFAILRAAHELDWPRFVQLRLAEGETSASSLSPLLSISLASRDEAALSPLLDEILNASPSSGILRLTEEIRTAAKRDGSSRKQWLSESAATRLREISGECRERLKQRKGNDSFQLAAIGLLGFDPDARDSDVELLLDRLNAQSPPAMQQRLINVLARIRPNDLTDRLIACMGTLGPDANEQILDLLLSRPGTAAEMLTAIQENRMPGNLLNASQRQSLQEHPQAKIREKASSLWSGSAQTPRAEVIANYQSALKQQGDASRGLKVYQKNCQVCHRWKEQGHAVGPDLSQSRNKSSSALLESILAPNRALDQRYAIYVVATIDGKVLQGLLASETADSITLKGEEEKQWVIPRDEIEMLKRTSRSVMPEGLEKDLTAQDLADVIALITSQADEE